MKGRKQWILWVSLVMAAVLGGSCPPALAKETVVNIGDSSTLRTLDPASIGVTQDIMNARNVYQGLLRYKMNSYEIEGDLAKSWTVSPDGLVYTFKLLENVTWHKGFGKFTAHDVKYTFDRVLDPKTGAATRAEIVSELKEVKVVDDFTVQFHLHAPYVYFLHKLVGPRCSGIVNPKAVEKFGKDFGRNPIGTGPFVFDSWTREQVVFLANKDFQQRQGPPKIDKIVYRVIPDVDTLIMALQRGEVDVAFVLPRDTDIMDRLKAAGCQVIMRRSPTTQNLLMNTQKKPFDDVRVRRAVAHALDKDVLLKHVYGGMGERLDSPIAKGLIGYTEKGIPRYEYNPEKAKELLAQAGYPNGFEVVLDASPSPSHLPLCTAVSEALRKVNINAKLNVSDQATWWGKFSKGTTDFTTLVISWQPAPELTLLRYYHGSAFSPGLNVCRYDKIDDLIEQVRLQRNEKKQQEIYFQMQKRFMEDMPSVPICNLYYPIVFRPHLSGISEMDYVFWGNDFYYVTVGEKGK
jgi:ABC-type transport system substrate-binding protein